jgi:nucleotide-binding universal stress UspA family protein
MAHGGAVHGFPPDARISAMHVLPPPIPEGVGTPAWALGPEVLYPAPVTLVDRHAVEAEEQRQGERLRRHPTSAGSGKFTNQCSAGTGRRGDEIIKYIRAHEIDMVVCGSRGLSAVSGWFWERLRKLVIMRGARY